MKHCKQKTKPDISLFTRSILLSQFTEKGFKKTDFILTHSVVLLLFFLFNLDSFVSCFYIYIYSISTVVCVCVFVVVVVVVCLTWRYPTTGLTQQRNKRPSVHPLAHAGSQRRIRPATQVERELKIHSTADCVRLLAQEDGEKVGLWRWQLESVVTLILFTDVVGILLSIHSTG